MILTLSSQYVRNTVFMDENGLPVFKSDTPLGFTLGARTTTISRQKNQASYGVGQEDSIEVIGYIDWYNIGPNKFRIGDKTLESNVFLRRHGFFGIKRTFTGPDGRPYRWNPVRGKKLTLLLDDGSSTVIARYHRASLGIIGKRSSARLEIAPEAEYMLDIIVITFIYMQKLRMDRQRGG